MLGSLRVEPGNEPLANHEYVAPAYSVTDNFNSLPVQIDVLLLAVGTGSAFIITLAVAVAVQLIPTPSTTVTV